MPKCESSFSQAPVAAIQDVIQGLSSSTETFVIADLSPLFQFNFCWKCIDTRVEDKLHGSLGKFDLNIIEFHSQLGYTDLISPKSSSNLSPY